MSIAEPHEQAQTAEETKGYRIGELAKLTNSTTRTLRFYEEMNLLEPIRNSAGQRLYSETAVHRLNFINELKSGGFSLQEIKTFFESWNGKHSGGDAADRTTALIQKKLVEISELQRRIAKLNSELHTMVSYILACRGCDHRPAEQSCGNCDQHNDQLDPLLKTILKRD
jgi:MerR family copper efflux transcriptional regulator